jgi:hypothetical protein
MVTRAGDNRLVTDQGRFRRRLREEGVQYGLDGHIADTESLGWTLQWVLLPRRANDAADRLARAGRLAEATVTHDWQPMSAGGFRPTGG